MSNQSLDEFSAEKVLKVISMKEKECQTENKNVVLFIGISQSGKTTTINAFNEAKYEIKDDGTLFITNSSFKNGGITGGKAGTSCTIFPKIFAAKDLPFCFLDIQGYNDTRQTTRIDEGIELNSFEIQVISSLLTEIAVKKASHVSVILILNFKKYNIKDMQENGEMINNILDCRSNSLSMYILFNRYYTTSTSVLKKFFKLNGEDKINFVLDKIKNQTEEIEKEKLQQQNMEYFNLIKKNIDNNNFGYIDIEDESVIKSIKDKIKDLPCISKDQIKIDNSSPLRIEFDKLMKYKLTEYLEYLKQSYRKLVFPLSFFDDILKNINSILYEFDIRLKELLNGNSFSTKQEIERYLGNEIKNTKNEINNLNDKIERSENRKSDYKREKDKYNYEVLQQMSKNLKIHGEQISHRGKIIQMRANKNWYIEKWTKNVDSDIKFEQEKNISFFSWHEREEYFENIERLKEKRKKIIKRATENFERQISEIQHQIDVLENTFNLTSSKRQYLQSMVIEKSNLVEKEEEKIKNFSNDINKKKDKLKMMENNLYEAKFVFDINQYFKAMGKNMTEKRELIQNIPDISQSAEEIKSYINISRKLDANIELIDQIHYVKKRINNHQNNDIFSFKLIESYDWIISKKYPSDVYFFNEFTGENSIFTTKQGNSINFFNQIFDNEILKLMNDPFSLKSKDICNDSNARKIEKFEIEKLKKKGGLFDDDLFSSNPKNSNDPFSSTTKNSNDPFSSKPNDSNDPFSPTSNDSNDPFSPTSNDSNDPFSSTSNDSNDPFSSTSNDSNDPFSSTSNDSNDPFSSTSNDSNDPFSSTSNDSNDPFSSKPKNSNDPFSSKPNDSNDPFSSKPKNSNDPFSSTSNDSNDPFSSKPKA